jgi:hypothetical protein
MQHNYRSEDGVRGSTNIQKFTKQQRKIFTYLTSGDADRKLLAAYMVLNATTLKEQAEIAQQLSL